MEATRPRSSVSLRRIGLFAAIAQSVVAAGLGWWLWRSGMGAGALWAYVLALLLIVGMGLVAWAMVSWKVGRVSKGMRVGAGQPGTRQAVLSTILELDGLVEALAEAQRVQQVQASRITTIQQEQQAILQSMDGGVLVLDAEQRILSMNRAAEWMLGITGSASRGRLLQEVSRQPDLHRFVSEALEDETEDREFALQGAPARRVRAAHSRLQDSNGATVGLLVVLSDLTQLRRLESVRTDFASNVSHELRTPITNIKGYVETLIDMNGQGDPEQTDRFLKIIQRNADRLGAIVEDMLMLTQLERPGVKDTLATERTRIAPILEMVEQNLEAEAAAKNMTVLVTAPDDLWGQVNPQLVEQAISNLVVNAVKYSPAGKRVWIRARGIDSARDGGQSVEVTVTDEGPGIGEEHLNRVFERFYRVDKARSREAGGTGLGLAIVKHIVQLHGGRVEVESAIGRGSTFRVILPSADRAI